DPPERIKWTACISAVFYVLPLALVRKHPGWLMWWLVLMGAIVPVMISDLSRGSFMLNMPRYTIGGSIPICAMLGALAELGGWTRAVGWAARAVPAIVAIACALTLPEFYQRQKPDLRDMATYIATRARVDDLILIAPQRAQWTAYVLELAISHYAHGAPCPMAILTHPPDSAMLRELGTRQSGTIWIIGNPG